MKKPSISDIACKYNLELVNIVYEDNPIDFMKPALIGFTDIKQIYKISRENFLKPVELARRKGDTFFRYRDLEVLRSFNLRTIYDVQYNTAQEFYEKEIRPKINSFSEFKPLQKFIRDMAKVMTMFEDLKFGDFITKINGEFQIKPTFAVQCDIDEFELRIGLTQPLYPQKNIKL